MHLHYVEGYPTDEVARLLNCEPATARTWLYRARERVRDLLASREGTPSNPEDAAGLRKEASHE